MAEKIFCGVEGGASVSKLVLVKETGEILCTVEGASSNYLLVGLEECQKRIADMIEIAKEKAGIASNTVLDGLGLCMSGCEEEEANREFERNFSRKHPHLMKSCTVASDTFGPLYAVSPKGGLVLIAGTGSNSLLVNPDGTTGRCGGWGHLVGDEASAMWISLRAVKTVLDHEDNLKKCKYDVSKVKEQIFKHFKITENISDEKKKISSFGSQVDDAPVLGSDHVHDLFGILEHCYTNFNKTSFAGLCAKLAAAANEVKDPLCCDLFYEAGKMLAAMVVALRPKVHKELLESVDGLPIVCVGSVFKSWNLLEKGFVEGIGNHYEKCILLTLKCSAAIGAAFLAAKATDFQLPLDYKENAAVLYKFNLNK